MTPSPSRRGGRAGLQDSNSSSCMAPTWYGFIHSTHDALVLLESCLLGKLNHIPRRPHDRERGVIIASGNTFIYEENASGIKRWTDGVTWSPSRIMNNFLVYRELNEPFPAGEKKKAKKRKRDREDPEGCEIASGQTEEDRKLVGSLVDSYGFKKNGLIKKTLNVKYQNVNHHIVSYYNLNDVKEGLYKRPLFDESLVGIVPRQELMEHPFKCPVLGEDDMDIDPFREPQQPPTNFNAQVEYRNDTPGGSPREPMTAPHALHSIQRTPTLSEVTCLRQSDANLPLHYPLPISIPAAFSFAAGPQYSPHSTFMSHPVAQSYTSYEMRNVAENQDPMNGLPMPAFSMARSQADVLQRVENMDNFQSGFSAIPMTMGSETHANLDIASTDSSQGTSLDHSVEHSIEVMGGQQFDFCFPHHHSGLWHYYPSDSFQSAYSQDKRGQAVSSPAVGDGMDNGSHHFAVQQTAFSLATPRSSNLPLSTPT